MNLNNLILHITLPQGIKTTDGATLMQPVTFDAVSSLTPFYASVDQIKSVGGYSLRKLSDLTIASQIYMSSKAVDMMNYSVLTPGTQAYNLFINARNQWVVAKTGSTLMLSLGSLLATGSHVLANFSVTQGKNSGTEGNAGKLLEYATQLKLYDPTIRSGGRIEPGGHARPMMAAKGVEDWSEKTPGRQWDPYSPGANGKSLDMGSFNGGRGKPISFFGNPIFSPSFGNFRVGNYQLGMSLDCRNTCMGLGY